MLKQTILLVVALLLYAGGVSAQRKLSGIVTDERDIPIPGAKIFVKNDATMRTVCNDMGYYEMFLLPGEYFLIFQAVGYEDREIYIGMADAEQSRNCNSSYCSYKKSSEGIFKREKANLFFCFYQ